MSTADALQGGSAAGSSIAEKIDHLFGVMRSPTGEAYTYDAAAKAMNELAARRGLPWSITANGLWKLRTGRSTNPSMETIGLLAAFFGVDPNYFYDAAVETDAGESLATMQSLRDAGISNVQLRAMTEMSPEGRKMVTAMIDYVSELEASRRTEG